MFGLTHFDAMPLVYGVLMFLGIWSIYYKATHHKYFALAVELIVFVAVFKLHGGTMAGGFSAMICALIAGQVLPRTRRHK